MQSRGEGRTKIPLMSSASALALNTILTYLLIYGKLGLPEMSVAGAALATLFARALECGLLVGMIAKTSWSLLPGSQSFRDIPVYSGAAKSVTPVITNRCSGLSVFGYTYFYGRLGTGPWLRPDPGPGQRHLLLIVAGICSTCGAIIRNKIEAGEDDTARVYAAIGGCGHGFGALAGGLMVIITRCS